MSAFEKAPAHCTLQHLDIEAVFHQVFESSFRTRLVGGGDEPIYRPTEDPLGYHEIVYTRDYAASALHEIAHWCVAGPERRQLEDYGYWYAPDGRSADQQALFERLEVKPQAFEWIFSMAAGRKFRVSADNLEAALGASDGFKDAVHLQVLDYCRLGLPPRADLFAQALANKTGLCNPLNPAYFCRDAL
ncbi:elongation factor P hydroxylase [Aestuariicella hydrocarbonica]|uniref:Elongation factor P hydroxylase n=1 Tax=Pseudomaricurvus hydrocarbonicus TaxID=1470433 RepID=A0A9E5MK23_9GAMM|nr:elongation factor P hydroxylase [Aestuariicella hydrocarbonica]NHO64792.1 elongation factor P hydroxylase [Aestuariicella hydrocarbonica]